MALGDFNEILRYAIGLEQDSADLYQTLAEQATSPAVAKAFKEMSAQELGHKKRLESIESKGAVPTSKVHPDDDLKLADYLVDVDIKKPNLSYQESLLIAMKMENAALKLYTDLAARVEDAELKEVFTFLAKEEAKHKHSFEAEFDDNQG